MSCNLTGIVKDIIKGEAGTVTFPKGNVAYITPSVDSKKVKTIDNATEMARAKVKQINEMFKSKHLGNIVSIPSNPITARASGNQSAIIHIHPNARHQKFQEGKLEQEDAWKWEQEEKAKMSQEVKEAWENDALEADDYMPSSIGVTTEYDGFNYNNHVESKVFLRDDINDRIRILEKVANKDLALKRQIQKFKDLAAELSRDINKLQTLEGTLENFMEFFHKDVLNVQALLENPNIEDLNMVQEYLNLIESIFTPSGLSTAVSQFGFLTESLEKIKLKPEVDSDPIIKLFDNLQKDVSSTKRVLDEKKEEAIIAALEHHIKNTTKEKLTPEEIELQARIIYSKEIEGELDDINTFAAFSKTIDELDESMIHAVLRKTFDDAKIKAGQRELKQRFVNIDKKKLAEEVEKQGGTVKSKFFGILGTDISFDIFKRKSKKGKSRLIGKFTEAWSELKQDSQSKLQEIRDLSYKDDNSPTHKKLLEAQKIAHFKELKDKVDFVNPALLPEVLAHPDVQEKFGSDLGKTQSTKADSYKQELVAKYGITEYNRMAQEAIDNILDYAVEIEIATSKLAEQFSQEQVNTILAMKASKSPFALANNTSGKTEGAQLVEGVQVNQPMAVDLTYASFLPKAQEFIDPEFSKIENNPTLFEAWSVMSDGLRFVNQNGNRSIDVVDDSITSQKDTLKHMMVAESHWFSRISPAIADRIKKFFSTSKYKDVNNLVVDGGLSTIDQEVDKLLTPKLTLYKSLAETQNLVRHINIATLPKAAIDFLVTETGKTKGEISQLKINPTDLLRETYVQKVMDAQEIDLLDSILDSIEVVEAYKAKKEIETKMTFILNKIKQLKNKRGGVRDKSIELAEFFVENNLYDVNNRSNFNLAKKGDMGHVVYTSDELAIKRETKNLVKNLENALKNEKNSEIKQELQNEINALNGFLESGGRVITTGSVLEALILKMARYKAFFLNFAGQFKNQVFGSHAASELNGLTFKEGSYTSARSYVRKWKSAIPGKAKENRQLTDLLLGRLEVFQNSANEVFKVNESRAKSTIKKVMQEPLSLPGEVEKTIQRPQVLALLSDINTISIKDKNGVAHPIFNSEDLSNPHPAFEISADGNLQLKEAFDTPENKGTWLHNNTQEFANHFGDSGTIPKAISYINGDYRESTQYLQHKKFHHTIPFMFKQWLPAMINKKYGIFKSLQAKGKTSTYTEIKGQNLAAFAANTPFGWLGLGVAVANTGFQVLTAGKRRTEKEIADGITYMGAVGQYLAKQAIIGNFRLTGAAATKALQFVTNPITGKQVITDKTISNIAGYAKESEQAQAELQYLMASYARTLLFTALRVFVTAMLFPDDEEKEEWKNLKNKRYYEKLYQDPDTTLYYTLENLLAGLVGEVNLGLSPQDAYESVSPSNDSRSVSQFFTLAASFGTQLAVGDYTTGDHKGENRIKVQTEKFLLPSAASEVDPNFGFGSISKRDFSPNDYVTNIITGGEKEKPTTPQKEATKAWTAKRSEYRKNISAEILTKYPDMPADKVKSKANKLTNKQYPSIKKYFKEDGSYYNEKAVGIVDEITNR